jgi:hypothetical protein
MKMRQLFYIATIFMSGLLITACSGESNKKNAFEAQPLNGKVILEDAQTYADQQCSFNRRERALKSDPNVTDFELKMQQIKMDRQKAKNYYRKKYQGFHKEWVAFQRAVKAARQQPDYCKNPSKKKKKL